MNDETYQTYATDQIKTVPLEYTQYLVNLFMKEAAVNMGGAVDEPTLERSIYHIRNDFGYLPVCYVYSAFIRGSLGQFGAGRLVPRTIHNWLFEVSAEFNRATTKEEQKNFGVVPQVSFDLHKYPVGRAIMKKIEWYEAGLLPGNEWDRIDLRELSEAIGRHEHVTFNNFFR
jgi:hypothetical protein